MNDMPFLDDASLKENNPLYAKVSHVTHQIAFRFLFCGLKCLFETPPTPLLEDME